MKLGRLSMVFKLAYRDLMHGWRSTCCLVIAITAALIPLLLLFALKFGIVNNMIENLRADPRVREIKLLRDQSLSQKWFDEIEIDDRVAFILPRARYLASSVLLRSPESRSMLDARMIPTKNGDPFLEGLAVPKGFGEITLTQRALMETGVVLGDKLTLVIRRIVGDKREAVHHQVRVVGVVPRELLQTDDIFVSSGLENAIERWREGFGVTELGWEGVRANQGIDASERSFASFRLFARDVRDVPSLRDRLLSEHFDVQTRARDVENAMSVEANLSWIFIVITTMSSAGFLLTLGLHLLANVIEKARELSLLRLLGMSSAELALVPSIQGAIISALGALIAGILAALSQPMVNASLSGMAGLDGPVSELGMIHLQYAFWATTIGGFLSGSFAGYRSAQLEPSQGLRYD